MTDTTKTAHRILYISHGAGPLPVLGDERHTEMVALLKRLGETLPKPKAIVLASAHWEEHAPTVTGSRSPSLLYDYYGFPEESYELEYPAPGHPALGDKVQSALSAKGFSPVADSKRGFDHGMFIPLMLMYPEADIPCVQLSLKKGLDPAEHYMMGQALAQVEEEDLLIIGSGFSFHNMRAFFDPETDETRAMNAEFDDWLIDTCANDMEESKRSERLENWESAPHARYCHPREEHLLPLHVCCGAAGRACSEHFKLTIFGKRASAFLW